jgi:hypothetical protein
MMGNAIAPVTIFDDTMQWSTFTGGVTGIQYTTQNGGPPNCAPPSNKPRFATIQFVCQSGPTVFTMTNAPNLQGCSVAPGYVFQYTTPLACVGYVPPSCPYTFQLPCTVNEYSEYAWSGGLFLSFNENGNECAKIFFGAYLAKDQPADTCAITNGVNRMIGHMDILLFSKVMQMLDNNTIIFWDPNANSVAIGNPDTDTFLY